VNQGLLDAEAARVATRRWVASARRWGRLTGQGLAIDTEAWMATAGSPRQPSSHVMIVVVIVVVVVMMVVMVVIGMVVVVLFGEC